VRVENPLGEEENVCHVTSGMGVVRITASFTLAHGKWQNGKKNFSANFSGRLPN
jgi:hypothetical protein